MGHSDFTAFQLAALAHAGMDDVRRPDGRVRLRRGDAVGVHARSLLGPARQRPHTRSTARSTGPTSPAKGSLWGGNLAMVAHLVGTPHLPRVDGGILFLEDIGEHPYRIERMLYQLHFAGILARQRAVLLGSFNGYDLAPNDNGYDAGAMVAHVRARLGVHVYTGLPFGHCPDKLTLPVGGHCALTVRDGAARLVLSDYSRGWSPREARSVLDFAERHLRAGSKRALDETRVAVAVDGDHGRAARAVAASTMNGDDSIRSRSSGTPVAGSSVVGRALVSASSANSGREVAASPSRTPAREAPPCVRATFGHGVSSR